MTPGNRPGGALEEAFLRAADVIPMSFRWSTGGKCPMSKTIPSLKTEHPDAELTHEVSIGKIAGDQLTKLMSLGLSHEEAVNRIIQGFLK